QPVIEIRAMPRGGARHVHVIWDRWEGCPPENRAGIIRDAFKAARGEEYESSLVIAAGATVPEAADIGLLPFEVKPYKWYKLEGDLLQRARAALIEERGSVLGSPFLPQLRFATDRQADEA